MKQSAVLHKTHSDSFGLKITDWVIAVVILAAAFLIRLPLMLGRADNLPGDEVVFGLMAKHILQGEFPIYYWGQSYLGTLEAYVTAVLSLIFGQNGFTVQLGGFVFYELFLLTNYFLIKKLFGRVAAVLASVFLIVPPFMMMELSARALGGYAETLFLGALSLLLWLKVYQDNEKKYLIPLGLTLGVGLWLNSLFMVYIAAIGLLTFFRSEGYETRAKMFSPVSLITLKHWNIPIWLKIPFYAISVFLAFYIFKQLFVFFHGGLDYKILGIKFKDPAFQWKGVKIVLAVVLGEAVALTFLAMGWRNFLEWLKKWSGLFIGFLIGYLPAIIYNIAGGEGYRLLHKSGAIPAKAFGEKFQTIFLSLIPNTLWGGNVIVISLFIGGIVFFVWLNRGSFKNIFVPQKGIESPGFYFCFLGLATLLVTFISALVADRYLSPFYWVSAVALGTSIAWLAMRTKGIAALLVIPFILVNYQATQAGIGRLQSGGDIPGLARFLDEKGLKAGLTHYDGSYQIDFYGDERVIVIPRIGMIRSQKYRDFVTAQKKRALIFPADTQNEKEFLAVNGEFKFLEILKYDIFRIYVVDETFPLPQ